MTTTMASRQTVSVRSGEGAPGKPRAGGLRLVSLNPEAKDDFGHYLAFERQLARECASRGIDHLVLGSTEATAASCDGLDVVPTFDRNSWRAYATGRLQKLLDLWRCSRDYPPRILEALRQRPRRAPGTDFFFMYLAHPRHILAAIALGWRLRGRHPMVLNLFWTHFSHGKPDPGRDFVFRWLLRATRSLRRALNVHLCVDSEVLAERLAADVGEAFDVLPMFSVTDFSALEPSAPERAAPAGKVRVTYPTGSTRTPKGFDLVCRLAGELCREDVELVIRRVTLSWTEPKLMEMADRTSAAKFVEGVLPPRKYLELLASSDVLLLPYRRSEFHSRTSGVFADAMVLAKPMVGTADTWLGDRIEEWGCGETFEDGDVAGMRRALERVIDDLPRYEERIREARSSWLHHNNPGAFLDFLLRHLHWGDRAGAQNSRTDPSLALLKRVGAIHRTGETVPRAPSS